MKEKNSNIKKDKNEIFIYFINLWETMIDNLKKGTFRIDIVNPHILINEIVNELKFNNFANKERKEYYKNKLGKIVNSDPVIKEFYKPEFVILINSFDKYCNKYLLNCVLSIQSNLSLNKYFKHLLQGLKHTISKNCFGSQEKEELKILCKNIIIEFLLKGFDIDILKSETILQDNYVESINHLEKFYSPKVGGHNYIIFQVKGLKGKNIDLNIGNINFYSPQTKQYIQYIKEKNSNQADEFFGTNKDKDYINAAYIIDSFESESPIKKAIDEVDKVLDLIRCYYSSKINFEILKDNYIIVNSKGESIGFGYKASERLEWYNYHYSIDMKELNLHERLESDLFQKAAKFLFKDQKKLSDIESRIVQSIHWYRKAEESKLFEDKLLFFWIIIDRLMKSDKNVLLHKNKDENSYFLAKEFIPCLLLNKIILGIGWNLFEKIRDIIANQLNFNKT